MERSEIIPQVCSGSVRQFSWLYSELISIFVFVIKKTSTNLGTGHLYYHFSLSTSSTNPPNPGFEHQIALWVCDLLVLKHVTYTVLFGLRSRVQL